MGDINYMITTGGGGGPYQEPKADWAGLFGMIFAIVITTAILGGIVMTTQNSELERQKTEQYVTDMRYDVADVKVFCNMIDVSLKDFEVSPTLRKQYEAAQQGITTPLIQQAKDIKAKRDSKRSSAGSFVGGMVVGHLLTK